MTQQYTLSTSCLSITFLIACATLFAVGTAPVQAIPPEQTEIAKLLPVPGIELGTFGTSVSIDGGTLVVGAPNYVPEPTGPGLVYIYIIEMHKVIGLSTQILWCAMLRVGMDLVRP